MRKSGSLTVLLVLAAGALTGCAAPSATLDLISVARKGIASAKRESDAAYADNQRRLEAQAASLGAAFDADVKLAAAGKITSADGKAVKLSAEWVISARKGYAAARDLLSKQLYSSRLAHQTAVDNLTASDEALDMACELILSRWNISQQVKMRLLDIQRSLTNER